jgi:hypothetical protein
MGSAVSLRTDMEEQASLRLTKWSLALLIAILSAGIFLRVWPSAGLKGVGIDERDYAAYVEKAVKYGLSNYGRVVAHWAYLASNSPGAHRQSRSTSCVAFDVALVDNFAAHRHGDFRLSLRFHTSDARRRDINGGRAAANCSCATGVGGRLLCVFGCALRLVFSRESPSSAINRLVGRLRLRLFSSRTD